MKKLLKKYYNQGGLNSPSELLRNTVLFINSRAELANDSKSLNDLVKEYLIHYFKHL